MADLKEGKAPFQESEQRKESKYSILFKPSTIRLHGDSLKDHRVEQREEASTLRSSEDDQRVHL